MPSCMDLLCPSMVLAVVVQLALGLFAVDVDGDILAGCIETVDHKGEKADKNQGAHKSDDVAQCFADH